MLKIPKSLRFETFDVTFPDDVTMEQKALITVLDLLCGSMPIFLRLALIV